MDIVSFLLTVLIAFIIGIVAEKISPVDMPGGWAGAIVAGFIGAWLGTTLFGNWGPSILSFSLVPSILGAFIVVIGFGLIAKKLK